MTSAAHPRPAAPPPPSGPSATWLVGALSAWTFATGMVDAVTYLRLDHVFTANMTGNVVFLGFALAGERSIPVLGVLASVLGFVLGALVSGRMLVTRARGGRLVLLTVAVQALAVIAAAVLAATLGAIVPVLAALLGFAMGLQNATARKLAVPDITTTVLTLTVTGIAADRSTWPQRRRRLAMIALMLTGAAAGAALAVHVSLGAALAGMLVVLAVTAAAAQRATV